MQTKGNKEVINLTGWKFKFIMTVTLMGSTCNIRLIRMNGHCNASSRIVQYPVVVLLSLLNQIK